MEKLEAMGFSAPRVQVFEWLARVHSVDLIMDSPKGLLLPGG
jgi:hypothetical protein